MKLLHHERKHVRQHGPLTPLQLETTRRYIACGGRHSFTGEVVEREVLAVMTRFYVCGKCGVPVRGGQA